MKLYRSDLTVGLHDSLFEIPVETLKIDDMTFAEATFKCILSSEASLAGFKLTGTLQIRTLETCDRCLTPFTLVHSIPLILWLTADRDLISEANEDFIWFPENQDWIDLSGPLHDLVCLDDPIKKLCRPDCRGLCPHCGQNLNERSCSCGDRSDDDRWDTLQKLIN